MIFGNSDADDSVNTEQIDAINRNAEHVSQEPPSSNIFRTLA